MKKEKQKNRKFMNKFTIYFLIELFYLFIVEMSFKLLFGNLKLDWTIFRIFLSSGIISLIMTLITINMKKWLRNVIMILFNFGIVIYAWLQLGFVDFLGAFMSIGNAEQGTKITDYIVDFLNAYSFVTHLIYIPFILFVLFVIFEKRILKKIDDYKFKFKNFKNSILMLICIILLAVAYTSTLSIGFMQNKYQTVSNKSLFKYASNPSIAIKNFGTSVYFLLDIKGTIFNGHEVIYVSNNENESINDHSRKIDDTAWKELIKNEDDVSLNTLNNYFINRTISDTNEYTGIFEGKNLIMIMLESVSQAVFDEAYKDYFPTLYKLYSEGITGVNNYSPKNNCATGESEMTSQISLYSIETTCTVNTYKNNTYPEALLATLKNNGYYTSSYHNWTDQYYYRKTFEYKFGSNKHYSVTDLGIPYINVYKEWPSDVKLMETAVPKFVNEDKFASYIVTVTSHGPYNYSSTWGDAYLDLFKNLDMSKSVKRYLSKIKVVDLALENLLKQLEEAGKLEDTVLVLFGDHYPYALPDKEYDKLAMYDTLTNQEADRTPFIIYNSGTEGMKIERYTSPLDYVPTILNLFGVDYDPRYYMGHDVFSDYTDFVVFPDNSWQNKNGFYSASKGEFLPSDESEGSLNDEEIIAINTEVNDMRNMSALAIKKNYFKYLFEYFEKFNEKQEELESSREEINSKEENEGEN